MMYNAPQKDKILIFSNKEKAQSFVKSINKNEVRGKFSVRKTKGWNTYSVKFKPYAYSDIVELMKKYKPEKEHYRDISKDVSKG